ncbi:MAG: hypothetical protein AUJ85_01910 [Elusimicrobia bacterium CG1_02_37_114]|nr:MAG: hypothetical protein AUJ85_01910 [Elusimicrobia bacterium CG1_02_37_114]PIV53865.1 MAG: hypothetical protein COS17_01645 [Elusimicrobia bacterium CG02_land_8_20_14_3_00_37_13]PIZ14224.1 MAG: hypothetical protein COY53_00750 [Elusimicrobia bacterium CG_4_10_14_0_8_um_filter_37_32]
MVEKERPSCKNFLDPEKCNEWIREAFILQDRKPDGTMHEITAKERHKREGICSKCSNFVPREE